MGPFTVKHSLWISRMICGWLVWAMVAVSTVAFAEEAPAVSADAEVVETTPAEPDKSLELTGRTQKSLQILDALSTQVSKTDAVDDARSQVEKLQIQADRLLPEGKDIESLIDDETALDGVMARLRGLADQANGLIDDLADQAQKAEATLGEVRALTKEWQAVNEEAGEIPPALAKRVDSILSKGKALETQATDKLNNVVALQNTTLEILHTITPIAERIRSYDKAKQTRLLVANAPPIWQLSSDSIASSSEASSRRFFVDFNRDLEGLLDLHGSAVGGHLLLLPLLLFFMVSLRRSTSGVDTSALDRPLATGVLIWMLMGIAIYADAPSSIVTVYVMMAMVTAVIVLTPYLPKQIRVGVYGFVVIALLERLSGALPILDHMPRIVYLLIGLLVAGITVLASRLKIAERIAGWGVPMALVRGAAITGCILCIAGVVLNVVGYLHLSKLLISGVVRSMAVFLVLYTGMTTLSGVIKVLLGLRALDNVRSIARNRMRLNTYLAKPVRWFFLLLWLWTTAELFEVNEYILSAIGAIIGAKFTMGQISVSLSGVLVFVLAIWLAVWSSRLIRVVLNDDILPRMHLPRGVPNTISMTVHYAIILFGLLLGFGSLGIDLSSLAFIVGALGVGIGFGLQNVVSNFVSGLILIFEAPVEVGDTVEVGPLIGTVVRIGMRTSRVRTFSGSEVIVPNDDLISNQVINWTLSDRRRRLELQIGVAYGSDPDLVTELLREVVAQDDDIVDTPAPLIIFEEFGDSALMFRVYAWIADFDVGLGTRHRLNVAINEALAKANITIPFPQRDLHVKSLPDAFPQNPAAT